MQYYVNFFQNSYASNFYLNVFFVMFFSFSIASIFFLKTKNSYMLNNQSQTLYAVNFLAVLFYIILILYIYVNYNNTLHLTFVDNVFLSLFLLIVPTTFTLLIREEKVSTIFCFLNFLFLTFVVFFLIYAKDLIALVMGYELLFLPAFFILRKTVYSSAAQSAYSVFTVWSVLGSLLVVAGAVFCVIKSGSTQLTHVNYSLWSQSDLWIVTLLFFIGFGVKIPIWPFHYWLTRVHVEASTGFSIFLSGFLVKAAVYVCWKTMWSLDLLEPHPIFACICLFSVFDAVIKLAVQTDLKKLVAFATVFEMGLIFFFFMWKPATSVYYVFIFSFSHAFLSGLMFYLVECIYSRTHTRSVDEISGLAIFYPGLSKVMWLTLFVFWGLPLTLKFSVEVWVLLSVYLTGSLFLFLLIVLILFMANVSVTKHWLSVFYGFPQKKYISSDLSTFEYLYFSFFILGNVLSLLILN